MPDKDSKNPGDKYPETGGWAPIDSTPAEEPKAEKAIGEREQAGSTPHKGRAQTSEEKRIGDDSGWKTSIQQQHKNSKNMRYILSFFGVSSLIIGALLALFVFLLPFRLTHIVELIEQRVGNVPQYALEQRLEFYMSRYLMIRALEETGDFDFSPGGADRDRFTYLGDSFWDTMYTNWRGANLERKMVDNYNVKLFAANNNPEVYRQGKLRATDFRLEDLGTGRDSGLHNRTLNRPEARRFVKDFARSETKMLRVFKRWNMRRVMYKYYGIGRWKPFEKTRDSTGASYRRNKLAAKTWMVNNTVGRLSERYSLYLTCLLDASDSRDCREQLKKADESLRDPNADSDEDRREDGREQAAETLDDDTPESGGDSDSSSRLGRRITRQIQELGLKKALASFAAGVGIVDTVVQLYETADSGVINQVIYDKNAQQYMAFGTPILSAADQFQAGDLSTMPGTGDFDIEDLRVMQEIFDGFDESPLYQEAVGSASSGQQISRDCNESEADGNETVLDPGETVCPNKKLLVNKTEFTESEGWRAFGTVADLYSNTAGDVLERITDALGSALDAVGFTALVSNLADALGISEIAGRAFAFVLNWISGPVLTGAEVGIPAFDALYATIAVAQSSVGGDVGVHKEDTTGGAYLDSAQTSAIRDHQMQEYYATLESKPFFERHFSPNVKESVTGQIALTMPTSFAQAGKQLGSLISNPLNIISAHSLPLPGEPVNALDTDANPFDSLIMGFPVDHPVFTANNGEGMDYEEINEDYSCNQAVEDRPQNSGDDAFGKPDDVPFDVPVIPDPCLLEEAVTEASVNYLTGELGAADFEPLGGSGGAPSPGPVSDGGCPPKGDPRGEGEMTVVDGIQVHNCIADDVERLIAAAAADGVTLTGSGWRSNERQIELYIQNCGSLSAPSSACSPPTATPGRSRHESGTAIDFENCSTRGTACYQWLADNAAEFGLQNLPSEAWHWSVDGT